MPTFTGSITTPGKSEAIHLDNALFRLHPEFKQKVKVRAQVISPVPEGGDRRCAVATPVQPLTSCGGFWRLQVPIRWGM